MKARILILCLFACAALLCVWPAAFAAPDGLNRPPGDLPAAALAPQITRTPPVPTVATILITEQGLQPSEVTIQPGGVVTWTNQTTITQRLVSGERRRIYLPLVLRSTGGAAISAGLAPGAPTNIAAAPAWGGDIAPGGHFTQTFPAAGHIPSTSRGEPTGPVASSCLEPPCPR